MIIHVNRHKIAKNRKSCGLEPPIAVRKSKSATAQYSNKVEICDDAGNVVATVLYEKDHPLKCGATVYIDCKYKVICS